tara:strand:- start:1490 stop:2074 length:585 start_codon:yes stop_codon:yes gene_type:complete
LAKRNKSNDYIDNKEFFKAMVGWKDLVNEAQECDEDKPPITDYIGECFLNIAEHLSYRPNFINYPYREEMVGDGIENCLMYAHNFNPEKSKNPFSYFTQIIYYAFLRRIEKEKKQNYIKYKLLENASGSTINKWYRENYFEKKDDNNEVKDMLSKHFQLSDTDIKKFEPKKKKKEKKNLDVFLEDDKSEDSTTE